ncbi:MAG: alcohol dehydrogenase catalytic domain-containing protein [Clostridia bacterium]|nr:alcohol dehydrogenase catalytic domain-containing protein [Clostridia bacterium]
MKAAILYAPGDMRVETIEKPICPPGGALVKLHASLICGSDLKIYQHGHPKTPMPQIIGHESCGTIEAIDAPGSGLQAGDRVTIQTSIPCGRCLMCQQGSFNLCENLEAISWGLPGTFAEYIAIPRNAMEHGNLIKVPDSLRDEEVCLAEPLACVINGQELVGFSPGETVLVIGAGPIGLLHAELARAGGAGRILLAERSPNRLKMAEAFGYDRLIDTKAGPLPEQVLTATGGRGANVVSVTAPARAAQEAAVACAALKGRISLFGSLPAGDCAITLDSRAIHYRELKVFGAFSSSVNNMMKALKILASSRIRTDLIITHTMALERIVEGIQIAIRGEALKVLIRNAEDCV